MGNDNREDDVIYFAQLGHCFHTSARCPGLAQSVGIFQRRPCGFCSSDPVSFEAVRTEADGPHDVTIRERVRQHVQRGLMLHPIVTI